MGYDKHTPGTWQISEATLNNHHQRSVNIKCRGEVIAMALGIGHNGERNANARLIAASPKLLEACVQVIESGMSGFSPDLKNLVQNAVMKAIRESG